LSDERLQRRDENRIGCAVSAIRRESPSHCGECRAECSPRARFCEHCGAARTRRCSGCGFAGSQGARFCPDCGAQIEDEEERTLAAEPEAGERRQVTILFCDLVESTELAARLDPEDWKDVLSALQSRAGEVIARYGGHVAQYLGDGILVYFGWPKTWDDAAERAVRAGLALVDAADALRAEGLPLAVRVGLHTGPVVVSALGREGRSDTLALGDVPHLAARIQNAAAPGTVVVSAATQRLVAGMFVVEERGAPGLLGVRQPLVLYRVVRPSGVRSRLDAAVGRLTRFVGREVELATLFERWERAQDGEGQNVLVLGEAGVGKSRLAYELRERLSDAPHTWLECGASPYTRSTPFHPVIALLSRALCFDPGATESAKLERLHHGLGRLASPEAVALVADLLGLPSPGALAVGPDLQRRKTIDLLTRWCLAQSEAQPLVLAFEDLHWCDASSLEVLGRLVAQSATARLVLLMTARPEFAASWPPRENTTTLSLARLTRRHARDMIAALRGNALPPETLDALVDRAGGVPLFLEELTKSLVQPGAGQGIEAIPATLADSLMARLDRLPSAKEVAQRAAVLGRELDYPLIAAISGLDEAPLRQSLDRLVEAEILFVRGEPPDATYTFKHALVQEAARESLLKRTRQQLHGRVVDVLVDRFPARAEAEPERVARHAEAAGRIEDAIAFYRRAGERAQARSAHEEAIRHFEQAVELLATRPASRERDVLEASIQLILAESRAVALGYTSPAVEAAHARARELCEATGDTRRLGFALSGLAVFAYNSGRATDAEAFAARALEIAEETGDADLRLRAHCGLGLIECYRGRFASSLAQLEGAIALHRAGARPAGPCATGDPGVRALSASAWVIFALGFPDRALARAREGVARAREIAHPFNVAHALLFETVAHTLRRDVAAQREGAARVIALAETHAFPFWKGVGLTFLGSARVAEGDRAGIDDVRAGLAMTAATGTRGGAPLMLAQLAEATLAAGLLEDARGAARAGLALAAETGQLFYDSSFHWLEARILLAGGGDVDEAEILLRRAVSIARDQGARSFELRAATSLARLLRDRRQPDEARALLAPILDWFTEGFDTPDLAAAKSLLESLR